jgi:hypothetical protein
MTKKDFREMASFHDYGGRKAGSLKAIFYDWKEGDYTENGINKSFRGFKFCVFARSENATKKELENVLFDFINGVIEDSPWYIQLIVAETDAQRFKVPIMSSGLRGLIKYEKV